MRRLAPLFLAALLIAANGLVVPALAQDTGPDPGASPCPLPGQGAPSDLTQAFRDAYDAAPVDLGMPTSGPTGCVFEWGGFTWAQEFDGPDGTTILVHQPADGRVYRLYGDWLRAFMIGGPDDFGAPIEEVTEVAGGAAQGFDGGDAGRMTMWKKDGEVYAWPVHGAIREAYGGQGWEEGPLGWPLSFEYARSGGVATSFENGYITCCADGAEVHLYADEPPPPDVLGCATTGRTERGSIKTSQSDSPDARLDTVFRFEVSYCKVDDATYLITSVSQWMELTPQTGTPYYWMSLSYGRYDGKEVQGERRGADCVPLEYGEFTRWSPKEPWAVSINGTDNTFGSKVSNDTNCASGVIYLENAGEEYPGAVELRTY